MNENNILKSIYYLFTNCVTFEYLFIRTHMKCLVHFGAGALGLYINDFTYKIL